MDDYEIGFGKPPKRFRFKQGQSGNPKGRPKGRKNISTIIEQVCHERVRVKGEDGTHYYISKLEAIMTQLTNQAVRGDVKAAKMCFEILNMFPIADEAAETPEFHIHFVGAKNGKPLEELADGTEHNDPNKQP